MTEKERLMNCPNGVTASRTIPKVGTLACDKSLMGKKLWMNGQVYTCEDRGSKVNGNHIDVYVPTISEAYKHGVQEVEFKVL